MRLTTTLNAHPAQYVLVKKEATKKRNLIPVRRLFEQAPEVLGALKPVWAMSPLQVSRLLPAAACFDVAIFDEASQIKPADAIPSLVRTPQVIVAGNRLQLPPTEFFTKVLEDAPDDDVPPDQADASLLTTQVDDEDAALDAPPEVPAPRLAVSESHTRNAESILTAFERVLAGHSRRLSWHYRSRDERLIAVSNEFIYRSSLTTFPSVDGHERWRHEVVVASPGLNGKSNSPQAEVRRVVELVLDHSGPGRSRASA